MIWPSFYVSVSHLYIFFGKKYVFSLKKRFSLETKKWFFFFGKEKIFFSLEKKRYFFLWKRKDNFFLWKRKDFSFFSLKKRRYTSSLFRSSAHFLTEIFVFLMFLEECKDFLKKIVLLFNMRITSLNFSAL